MLAVVGATEHYVRHEGLHPRSAEELEMQLPMPATPAARRMRKDLLEFVRRQGRQAKEGERLLGSSEVLESIIGKFKNLAGEDCHHGLTGMVLSIGALVGKLTVATVEHALAETPTREVWEWCKSHLGTTVQSARAHIRQALSPEENQPPLLIETG
jgi:hypothetical protein